MHYISNSIHSENSILNPRVTIEMWNRCIIDILLFIFFISKQRWSISKHVTYAKPRIICIWLAIMILLIIPEHRYSDMGVLIKSGGAKKKYFQVAYLCITKTKQNYALLQFNNQPKGYFDICGVLRNRYELTILGCTLCINFLFRNRWDDINRRIMFLFEVHDNSTVFQIKDFFLRNW
jgi:hypothetical protein